MARALASNPLLLAAGKLSRIGLRLVREAYELQKLHGPFLYPGCGKTRKL